VGFLSGIFGFAFYLFFVFPRWGISGNFLLMWIILLWNFFSIIISGLGGSVGSMVSVTSEFFSDFNFRSGDLPDSGTGREEVSEKAENGVETSKVFIVCPSCGTGNPEGALRCKSCGEAI